ncbi:NYN domain-containing protein [Pelosinus propionicus]|nr:NYN domain-containing protein [Pelosinus propionicus]
MEEMIDLTNLAHKAYVFFDKPNSMPNEKEQPWVALFIDGDGLGRDVSIKKVLAQAEELGDVVVRRVYANYTTPSFVTRWMEIYKKYLFERRIFHGVHKNIADMGICCDAVELALNEPRLDYFIIVSHDGGFFPLMAKLDELKKKVYWIGGKEPLKKAERLQEELDNKEKRLKLSRKVGSDDF